MPAFGKLGASGVGDVGVVHRAMSNVQVDAHVHQFLCLLPTETVALLAVDEVHLLVAPLSSRGAGNTAASAQRDAQERLLAVHVPKVDCGHELRVALDRLAAPHTIAPPIIQQLTVDGGQQVDVGVSSGVERVLVVEVAAQRLGVAL